MFRYNLYIRTKLKSKHFQIICQKQKLVVQIKITAIKSPTFPCFLPQMRFWRKTSRMANDIWYGIYIRGIRVHGGSDNLFIAEFTHATLLSGRVSLYKTFFPWWRTCESFGGEFVIRVLLVRVSHKFTIIQIDSIKRPAISSMPMLLSYRNEIFIAQI